jgi:hypothetical protein
MIKINFKEVKEIPESKLVVYNDVTRIPFEIEIGNNLADLEPQYTRYIVNQNFIEFRFRKEDNILYNIVLVSFDDNSISKADSCINIANNSQFYSCILEENSDEVENLIEIGRGEDFIAISFSRHEKIEYYAISKDCLIGIDPNSNLVSVIISNLSDSELIDVFGY